jgi:AcrR family transcriptional regulator
MSKIRSRRAEMSANTTQRLISVARTHFAKHGYSQVVMDNLCRDADLTRGALHHHFGGKKGLFAAVVKVIFEEITEQLESHYQLFNEPWQGYVETCIYYIDLLHQEGLKQILILDAPAVLGDSLRQLEEQYYIQPLIDSLRLWQNHNQSHEFEPAIMAHLIDGAIMNASLWIFTQPDVHQASQSVKKTLRIFLQSLTYGLKS